MTRRAWYAAAGLLLLTLLAYSNSFTAGFVLDNRPLILNDPRVHEASDQNLSDIFRHTYWWPTGEAGLYRPLTTLSYLFNYSIGQDSPEGYHWINLLLHLLNAVLLYLLVVRLTGGVWIALAAAGLWCLHPVLTEAVTNIVGRADLLAGTALIGGTLVYLKARESVKWMAPLVVVAALGAFSKESAVVLAGIIVLYELGRRRVSYRGWVVLLPIAAYLLARSAVLAVSPTADFPYFDNPITGASFWVGKLTALKVLGRYLGLIVWPAKLSCDYSYNQIPLARGSAGDWAAWIAVAAIVGAAVWCFRRSRVAFFFAGFAALAILPASNLLFASGTIMAERLVYSASAGVIAWAAIGIAAAGRRWQMERATLVAAGIVACAFAARTWMRNRDWQDDLNLARATVSASPNSFKAHQMLAEAIFLGDAEHRDLDPVIAEAERGIAILNPLPDRWSSPELYRLAGDCYLRKGQPEKALPVLKRGAAILAAIRAGRTDSASSVNDDIYRLLSMAAAQSGRPGDALAAAREAVRRDPMRAAVWEQLSTALRVSGDAEGAESALLEGLLVTSDVGLRQQLLDAYRTESCALMVGPNGPAVNPSCPAVHRQMCGVAADAIRISLAAGRRQAAASIKQSMLHDYGCPAAPILEAMPN